MDRKGLKRFVALTGGALGVLFGISMAEGLPELALAGFVICMAMIVIAKSRVEEDSESADEMLMSLTYKSGYRVAMAMSVLGALAGVVLLALANDGHPDLATTGYVLSLSFTIQMLATSLLAGVMVKRMVRD